MDNMNEVEQSDHLFVLTDKFLKLNNGDRIGGVVNRIGGKVAFLDVGYFKGIMNEYAGFRLEAGTSTAHEFGHLSGLSHNKKNPFHLMRQGGLFNYVPQSQLVEIFNNWYNGKLNQGGNTEIYGGRKRPKRNAAGMFMY